MREKYIEESFPRYFEFGEHADGRVDIATIFDGTVATVSPEHAKKLIEHRADIVRKLCEMANAFESVDPDAFHRFLYGK